MIAVPTRFHAWLFMRFTAACGLLLLAAALPAAAASDLHRAVVAGTLDQVAALLDAGASPEEKDSRGVTPLMLAAATGRQDVADLLIQRGADPFMPKEFFGLTMYAEKNGHPEFAQWLRQRMKTLAASDAGLNFDVSFRQDGHDVAAADGVVKLKPAPFEMAIRLPRTQLVSANVARTSALFDAAVAGRSLDSVFGFKGKALAGAQGNADEDLVVDTDAYQAWFYLSDANHRCNEVRTTDAGTVCVRRVRAVWEKDRAIPIDQVSDLYLVLISARDASRMEQVEGQRKTFHLLFR